MTVIFANVISQLFSIGILWLLVGHIGITMIHSLELLFSPVLDICRCCVSGFAAVHVLDVLNTLRPQSIEPLKFKFCKIAAYLNLFNS